MQRRATAVSTDPDPSPGRKKRRGSGLAKVWDLDAPPPPRMAPNLARLDAGAPRRLLALSIDGVVLMAVAFVAGAVSPDALAELGEWGTMAGASVAALYFAIANSRLGRGQTIGKRLVGIHVVGRDAKTVSALRTFVRAAFLLALFGGFALPLGHESRRATILALSAALGGGLSLLCLAVFNRRSGQSVHDLVAGTWVTRGVATSPTLLHPTGRGTRIAVAVSFAAALVAATMIVAPARYDSRRAERRTIAESIERVLPVRHVSVVQDARILAVHGRRARRLEGLQASLVLSTRPQSFDAIADEVASLVIRSGYDLGPKGSLTVSVAYGYDVLLARRWDRHSYSFPLPEWKRRLARRDFRPVSANDH